MPPDNSGRKGKIYGDSSKTLSGSYFCTFFNQRKKGK
nr:MAG TPA: hypothetical protein [Caudoviricetes sp.]